MHPTIYNRRNSQCSTGCLQIRGQLSLEITYQKIYFLYGTGTVPVHPTNSMTNSVFEQLKIPNE